MANRNMGKSSCHHWTTTCTTSQAGEKKFLLILGGAPAPPPVYATESTTPVCDAIFFNRPIGLSRTANVVKRNKHFLAYQMHNSEIRWLDVPHL